MGLTAYDIKRILRPKKDMNLSDDFRMIDSWAIFKDGKDVNKRDLEYLCYELEAVNPDTGEKYHYYKALKFLRIIRLPKSSKQSTAFMDMHAQVLSSVYECGINLVTVIANIIEPVPLGLLYLYGVQGTGHSVEEAQEQAHDAYTAFRTAMQGTYRVLEMRCVNAQETEWLREKMYNMDYLTIVRGIPKANQGGEDMGNKGLGASNMNPDSQGTLEEIIAGMVDYEYVIQVLSTPVFHNTLVEWSRKTQKDMTDWNSQLQGTKSMSFNLSVPMMFMGNQSTSQGWNKAYTDADSVNYSHGQSFNTSFGENVGQALSQTYGQSYGQTHGQTVTDSISQSHSLSQGQTFGQTIGQSFGHSQNLSQSQGMNLSQGQGISQGTSYNLSHGQNQSMSHSIGNNQSVSASFSESVGQTNGATVGQSASQSIGQSLGDSYGTSWNQGTNLGLGHTSNYNHSGNWSDSWGDSASVSRGGLFDSVPLDNSMALNRIIQRGTEPSTGSVSGGLFSFSGGFSNQNVGLNSNFGGSHGVNDGYGWSDTVNAGYSSSFGGNISHNASVSNSATLGQSSSLSESLSHTSGMSQGQSYGVSENYGLSNGESLSEGWGANQSMNSSMSVGQNMSNSVGYGTNQSISASQSLSQSQTESFGITQGRSIGNSYSESVSENVSQGNTQSYGQSQSVGQGESVSDGYGSSQSLSTGASGAYVSGSSSSMGLGPSIGYNKSYQWLDQQVKDILELLEFQNERIKKALRGEGAFYTYVAIACPTKDALSAAMAAAKATWQNEYAMVNPIQVLDLTEHEQRHLLYHFAAFSTDVTRERVAGVEEYKYETVLLPNEFVAYTHLPRISEGGVFADVNDVPKFAVPSMMKGEIYMGTILSAERYSFNNGYHTPYDFRIDESELMHGFFTGASRSGKTVAAMRFIAELSQIRRKKTGKRMRIVAMDPKQDWRTLARFVEPERFRFYNLGRTDFRPIKINPLKIPKGVEPQFWIDGLIDIYCRAYGLLERGKQMMGETIYALYQEAGVFEARKRDDWKTRCPELSREVTFNKVYKRMESIKASLEDPTNPKGRAGNDTRDAYARLLDRLQAFNREFAIEYRLFGTEEGIGVDELIGDDDVTVLESKGLEKTFRNFIFGIITSGFYKYAIAHEGGFLAEDQYETLLVIEEANEVLTGNDAAGSGGGSSMGLTVSGQSEFEEILDQSAGYGLFIMAITQRISLMPASIIANAGLVFAGRLKTVEDITTVIRSVAREERYDDRDLVKWFPRSPTGWFVCQSSRSFDFKDCEPVLVHIARLNIAPPNNAELNEILTRKKFIKQLGNLAK